MLILASHQMSSLLLRSHQAELSSMAHCASCHQTTRGRWGGSWGQNQRWIFSTQQNIQNCPVIQKVRIDLWNPEKCLHLRRWRCLGVHSHRSSRSVFAWMSRLKYSQTRKMYGISYLHLMNFHAKCRYRDTVTIH